MQTVNFDNLNVSAGDLVLDIGCGTGFVFELISKKYKNQNHV